MKLETNVNHTLQAARINDIAMSAFNAYRANRGNTDVRGGTIPIWEDVSEGVKDAWRAAILQAIDVYNGGSFGLDIEDKWRGWGMGTRLTVDQDPEVIALRRGDAGAVS